MTTTTARRPRSPRLALALIALVLFSGILQATRPQAADAATNTAIAVCSADFDSIEISSTLGYFASVYADLYQWDGSAWIGPIQSQQGIESVTFAGLQDGYYAAVVWLYGGWTGYQWQNVDTLYSIYDTGYTFVGTYSGWCWV